MPGHSLSEEDIVHVCRLVREAGDIAKSMRQDVGIRQKTGPNDLVTDADEKLSEMLLEALKKRFPDDLLISEEGDHAVLETAADAPPRRTWLIDPIDGTENYVKGDGQYAVMVGLVENREATFGFVYQPTIQTTFFGGPGYGLWKIVGSGEREPYQPDVHARLPKPVRVMLGFVDQKRYPWVRKLPDLTMVPSGSVGLKVVKVIEDQADMFVNFSGRMKLWDTAAPTAIALAAGLEVGTVDNERLDFPVPAIRHSQSIVMGRRGSMQWAHDNFAKRIREHKGK